MQRTTMNLDIHNYDLRFAQAEAHVERCDLSAHNKRLILRYRDACLLRSTCGRVRLIRVMGVLVLFGRLLRKEFDQAGKEDIEGLVRQLITRQPPYSPETVGTYKTILRNFMTWLHDPERYPDGPVPPIVSWIKTHVRKRDKKRLERRDLLTPADIKALLSTCRNPRDRALVAVLWETGCRISEIGNLRLEHVSKQPHGYVLAVSGKTGHRTPLVVSSAPYLTQWLQSHPFIGDPTAPLWVHYHFSEAPRHLKYVSIRFLLQRRFTQAGIDKPCNPHIFRHSRATYVLATGLMSEAQAKTYFGWTPDSQMLATYSHLVSDDANQAILKENHLAPPTDAPTEHTARACPTCGELNPPDGTTCRACSATLDVARAYAESRVQELKDRLLKELLQRTLEQGQIDHLARQIHEAGMGDLLQELASRDANPPADEETPTGEDPAAAAAAHPPAVREDRANAASTPPAGSSANRQRTLRAASGSRNSEGETAK